MLQPLFGTDGIRGRVDEHEINPTFAFNLGRAIGEIYTNAKVLIGTDTRESAQELESNFATGVKMGGASPHLLGVAPTPAVAYEVFRGHGDLGVVITASHNAYSDNGFKFFGPGGQKLDTEAERSIELALGSLDDVSEWSTSETLYVQDGIETYRNFVLSLARELGVLPLTAVLDCAHGSTSAIAREVLGDIFDTLYLIGDYPNGRNINEECGSTWPEFIQSNVEGTGADIGIAFDGDGDRVMLVDATGELVDGDQTLYLLVNDWQSQGLFNGGVVGTVMSNLALQRAMKKIGVPFERVDVGDKFVQQKLRESGWLLGGEPSGHLISTRHSPTGDGLVIALLVIGVMKRTQKSLQELTRGLKILPQIHADVPFDNRKKVGDEFLHQLVTSYEKKLGNTGRVVVRRSGTEPIVRIMVECRHLIDAVQTTNWIANDIRQAYGA